MSRHIPNRRLSEDEMNARVRQAYRDYPSLSWGEAEWFEAFQTDGGVFDAVLDGMGDQAEQELANRWSDSPDALSLAEAAEYLALSLRQLRRLAPELGGLRSKRGWVVPRGAVVNYRLGVGSRQPSNALG